MMIKGNPLGTHAEREAWQQSMAARNGGAVFHSYGSQGYELPPNVVEVAGYEKGSNKMTSHAFINVDTGESHRSWPPSDTSLMTSADWVH